MSQMLRMLEMQGMQPHNLQEQTQSSRSKLRFQTRNIDQTQKIPEMWGMPQKSQNKPRFFDISPKQPSKNDTSNPSNTLKIDFQKHDNAGRSNCSVPVGIAKKHSFLRISTVPQSITALGPTQTPNRPIPTLLETAKHN